MPAVNLHFTAFAVTTVSAEQLPLPAVNFAAEHQPVPVVNFAAVAATCVSAEQQPVPVANCTAVAATSFAAEQHPVRGVTTVAAGTPITMRTDDRSFARRRHQPRCRAASPTAAAGAS